jgi:hypothetical protein
MQQAIDMHISSIQNLVAEKHDYESRYRGEQRKAEDVRYSTAAYTRLFDVLVSQDRFEMD